MIKVLIVEDELPTARYIARLVEKHRAFTVAGTEINGERALQSLRTNPVDLIISDIQMPLMDGLQLLEIVPKEFPSCLTVMLSGYSYFEYARTALKLHAFDYLLKPIDTHTFAQMLSHAECAFHAQRRADTHAILERALSGHPVPAHSTRYQVLLATAASDYWTSPQIHCQLPGDFHVLRGANDMEQVLISKAPFPNRQQLIELHQNLPPGLHLIVADRPVCAADLGQTVDLLRKKLTQHKRLFSDNLLFLDQLQPLCRVTPLRDMHPEQAVQAICIHHAAALQLCFSQMWQIAQRSGFLQQDVEAFLSAILMDSRISQQISSNHLHQAKVQLFSFLHAARDRDACTDSLCAYLLSLPLNTSPTRDISQVVEEIAHYLNDNFHMPITTEDLAKRYNFVPQYLNRIFKKQKGVRPAEYLLKLRMQHAMHMLQTSPDILIKDVASGVGFSNHHYFSKVFHRTTGLWPSQVQKCPTETEEAR